MLKDLNVDQARFVAILAKAARTQRDQFLGNVPEDALGGVKPGRGEHNPTASSRSLWKRHNPQPCTMRLPPCPRPPVASSMR
jgi:hypothetical protein